MPDEESTKLVEPLFKAVLTNPLVGGVISLSGSEGKHAVSVRRMRVGEGIQLTDGRGLRVRGLVSALGQNCLDVSVSEVIHESVPAAKLTLIQALAKGDRDELAVQAATELGVWSVIPWQAERSVSRWEGAKLAKGVDRWQVIVAEAAKQSLRVFEPVVAQPVSSKQLAKEIPNFDLVFVLDPTADVGLGGIQIPGGNVAIVVGPEGGISETELGLFEAAGAKRVNLGAPILRTSTAGVAAIAVLQANLGLWT